MHSREQKVLEALLKSIREEKGLLQKDLADKLGKNPSFVSRFEGGAVMLDVPQLRQICHALGISLTDFIIRFEEALDADLKARRI